MAVEAHHLLHTGGGQRQLLAHAGWAAWAGDAAAAACYDEAPASAARQQGVQRSPCYGVKQVVAAPGRPTTGGQQVVAAAGRPTTGGQQVFQQSFVAADPALAAGQLVMAGRQYAAGRPRMCAADASESGVTFGGGGGAQQEVMVAAPRKRKRADDQGQTTPVLGLGAADVAAHFQQQLADVDRLVLRHTTKMWVELGEQRRRHARQVVAAVEAAAAKRLRAKDEEIQRIGRLNRALEERVRSLCVEAQLWRDLAQSNEATANAIRGELQQALDAQAQQARRGGAVGTTDDAESCCCGENDVAGGCGIGADDNEDGEEAGATSSSASHRRMCTMCGKGAAEVLLLPCRHLCACAPCAAAALACPACGCAKNGSVCVNFS